MMDAWTELPPSGTKPAERPTVGYGRPPTQRQFKPGQSGNRRGRPKGSKNEATLVHEILNRKIDAFENGKRRRISVLEAILLKFVQDALQGNSKSATFLLNRKLVAESSKQPVTAELDKDDRKILESYTRKVWEQFQSQEGKK